MHIIYSYVQRWNKVIGLQVTKQVPSKVQVPNLVLELLKNVYYLNE